jgi:hypothetical protein
MLSDSEKNRYQIPQSDITETDPVSSARNYVYGVYSTDSPIDELSVYRQSRPEGNSRDLEIDRLLYIGNEIEEARLKKLASGSSQSKALTETDLITKESEIGGRLFGQDTVSVQCRFWYEGGDWFFFKRTISGRSVRDETIHVEITENGIVESNSNPGVPNKYLQGAELQNFINTTELYMSATKNELYSDDFINNSSRSSSETTRIGNVIYAIFNKSNNLDLRKIPKSIKIL